MPISRSQEPQIDETHSLDLPPVVRRLIAICTHYNELRLHHHNTRVRKTETVKSIFMR